VYRLAFNVAARTLFGVTRGGVYRSLNLGESWTYAGLRYHDGVPAIGVDRGGAIYASTFAPTDFFRSRDNGQTWSSIKDGIDHQGVILALAFDGDAVYVGTSGGNLLRLSGESWEIMHTFEAGRLWINVIGIEPGGVVFLGTSQGLYRMGMEGGNNDRTLVQVGVELGITSLVTALTVHHNKDIFIGTTRAVYRIDAGGNIKQIGGGVSALAVTNDGEIFAGSRDGIRHSNDDGAYWAKVGPEAPVYSLIVLD
jgi:hypothetical protein